MTFKWIPPRNTPVSSPHRRLRPRGASRWSTGALLFPFQLRFYRTKTKQTEKRCRPGIPSCARFVCLKKRGGFISCILLLAEKGPFFLVWPFWYSSNLCNLKKTKRGCFCTTHIWGEEKRQAKMYIQQWTLQSHGMTTMEKPMAPHLFK